MANFVFLVLLIAFFSTLFVWAFRNLPLEHWQIIAAVPCQRRDDGTWNGINLTFYGFFNASACVFSCAIIISLMSSIDVPVAATLSITCLLFLICVPAAKIVARIVERKSSTFTVGGASFVGIVLLPWIIQAFNGFAAARLGVTVPTTQMPAAVAIAYAFGEAFGRLACISFGCCYGKLIWQAPMVVQRILCGVSFNFKGHMKKVAYEGDLLERPLIPVQAATAVVSSLSGVVGVFFFLQSAWIAAVLVPIVTTQVWRIFSEMLRADYRGGGRISAYQLMAAVALVYSLGLLAFVDSSPTVTPNIVLGLRPLLNTPVLLFLETLWVLIFLYTGRSSVTASRLSFHVVREKI